MEPDEGSGVFCQCAGVPFLVGEHRVGSGADQTSHIGQ